jgi:hypothetical protein
MSKEEIIEWYKLVYYHTFEASPSGRLRLKNAVLKRQI